MVLHYIKMIRLCRYKDRFPHDDAVIPIAREILLSCVECNRSDDKSNDILKTEVLQ